MSYQGMPQSPAMPQQQGQMSPDQMKQMMLAQMLMSQGQQQPQGQMGGLANAGSQILGALSLKNAMKQADPMHVNVTPAANASFGDKVGMKLGNLFGMGG